MAPNRAGLAPDCWHYQLTLRVHGQVGLAVLVAHDLDGAPALRLAEVVQVGGALRAGVPVIVIGIVVLGPLDELRRPETEGLHGPGLALVSVGEPVDVGIGVMVPDGDPDQLRLGLW